MSRPAGALTPRARLRPNASSAQFAPAAFPPCGASRRRRGSAPSHGGGDLQRGAVARALRRDDDEDASGLRSAAREAFEPARRLGEAVEIAARAAATVTAKPKAGAIAASATATGEAPRIRSLGFGSTGSTKMSIVPWLGQAFLANRRRLVLARRDAERVEPVLRRDRDQSRSAVDQALPRRLHHRGARASAADPAFLDRAVPRDQRLGPRLGGGDRQGANDGRHGEGFAFGFMRGGAFENAHQSLAR